MTPLVARFEGQRAGQADHAVLGRDVGRHVLVADQPRGARDVDDAPAAGRQHAGQHHLAAQEGAVEVHRHHPAPQREIGPGETARCRPGRRLLTRIVTGPSAAAACANAVSTEASSPMSTDCACRRARSASGVAPATCGRRRLGDPRQRVLQRRRVAAHDRDRRAGGRQRLRDGQADAPAAAGDDRVPAGQRRAHRHAPAMTGAAVRRSDIRVPRWRTANPDYGPGRCAKLHGFRTEAAAPTRAAPSSRHEETGTMESTQAFRDARDLLLRHREDYATRLPRVPLAAARRLQLGARLVRRAREGQRHAGAVDRRRERPRGQAQLTPSCRPARTAWPTSCARRASSAATASC